MRALSCSNSLLRFRGMSSLSTTPTTYMHMHTYILMILLSLLKGCVAFYFSFIYLLLMLIGLTHIPHGTWSAVYFVQCIKCCSLLCHRAADHSNKSTNSLFPHTGAHELLLSQWVTEHTGMPSLTLSQATNEIPVILTPALRICLNPLLPEH